MLFFNFQELLGHIAQLTKKDCLQPAGFFHVRSGWEMVLSNMSKDNKEGETSKKNPAVFIRYRSLVESQMVQSFSLSTFV